MLAHAYMRFVHVVNPDRVAYHHSLALVANRFQVCTLHVSFLSISLTRSIPPKLFTDLSFVFACDSTVTS